MKQAATYEEIVPLVDMCKMGRLFDVQAWIAAGKPVNPPPLLGRQRRRKSPLQIAIDKGFHSLVHILLEGGAHLHEGPYAALDHALNTRRFDLVQLLVEHGADIHSVDMEKVFDTWSPDIIEYFIAKGGDLEKDDPLASALCSRIRPALGIFKRHVQRLPGLRKQLNIALRYHCKEGNLKWISLLLWAGADPYERGPYDSCDEEPEEWISALELAALYGHFDVFKLKNIRLDPTHPEIHELLRYACYNDNSDLLILLLEKGFNPGDLDDKGTSIIQSLISSMSTNYNYYSRSNKEMDIDTFRTRKKMKMLHLLIRNGARWEPDSPYYINNVRSSLLKMSSDYVMEFVWIMVEYRACTHETIETLMKTPKIRSLVSKHVNRLKEIMDSFSMHTCQNS